MIEVAVRRLSKRHEGYVCALVPLPGDMDDGMWRAEREERDRQTDEWMEVGSKGV